MGVDEEYSSSIKRNLNPINKYKLSSKPPDKVIKTFGKGWGRPKKEAPEEGLKEVVDYTPKNKINSNEIWITIAKKILDQILNSKEHYQRDFKDTFQL